MKHALVYESPTSLNSPWLAPIVSQYFDLVPYDSATAYSDDTIFCINVLSRSPLLKQGRRVVIDNLWERPVPCPTNCYAMTSNNWFWYNESLWATDLRYNNYVPKKTYSKLALMPMRLQKPHRDLAIIELAKYLDMFIWSYVSKGRLLPNDADPAAGTYQRYFNPEWYNDTYFSLVIETGTGAINNTDVFVTEKTFKPICFQQPFMVFGYPGTLAHLRTLGFETFENLFDENYDNEKNYYKRLQLIKNNVENFIQTPYDNLTLEKIQHNYNHFFDRALVEHRIIHEIINPLIEYVNTKA
jgi:hypothetical protein